MSEAEQIEAPQQVAELLAELAEVRKKCDKLGSQNLRVIDSLQRTTEERDKAVKVIAALQEQVHTASKDLNDMTAQRDHAKAQWEECCEDRSRQVTSLREQLRRATVLREQWAEMTVLREQLRQMTAERDVALEDVRLQLAAKSVIIAERDAAELERTESRAEVVQLQAERDAASEQLARCKEEVDTFEAENDSLQDTIRKLRAKQVHDDLPGILLVIQRAVEQARELI